MNTAAARPASVIAPVYKNTPYLEPAIRSILAQDYHPLQIVIIDDASPDDAFKVLQRIVGDYSGPHEIVLHRNEINLSMAIYNELMARATADHIIVTHDDDIQRPDRVKHVMEAFRQEDISMVACNAVEIDRKGRRLRTQIPRGADRLMSLSEIARAGRPDEIQGAAMNWRRDVFETFGPIDIDGTARTSDFIFPFRAALLGDIKFLDAPLLERRVHQESRGKIGHVAGDEDVTRVEIASEEITQLSYMIETLDAFAQTHPEKKRVLKEARANLLLRLEELAQELGTHRNRLHMRKMKMSWIERASAPSQPKAITTGLGQLRLNAGKVPDLLRMVGRKILAKVKNAFRVFRSLK